MLYGIANCPVTAVAPAPAGSGAMTCCCADGPEVVLPSSAIALSMFAEKVPVMPVKLNLAE